MASTSRHTTSLPLSAEDRDFLYALADDTEDAPWMVMSDPQFWAIADFVPALRHYRRRLGLPGYVASMLPILYTVTDSRGRIRHRQIAPDAFLAPVADHARSSYDLALEQQPPSFVLEVVSPSSTTRDERDKVRVYNLLGVAEYALFTPGDAAGATLKGYRRDANERFVPWQPDGAGRLWSEVLELWLVSRGGRLRAETRDGVLLRTLEEAEAAEEAQRAARERLEADREADRAELARLQALLHDQDTPAS
jgi:Uma2 family endonuclease